MSKRYLCLLTYLKVLPFVILFGAFLGLLLTGIKTAPGIYDEGFAVYGAWRVLHGDVPYKDFWTIYAPGQFYTLAALFELFGENLLVARVYDVIVRLAILALVYLIGKRLTTPLVALAPVLVSVVWLTTYGYYTYAILPALAGALLGILSLLEYLSSGRLRWLAASGVAVGVTTVFRLDVGAYAGVGVGLALVLASRTGPAVKLIRPALALAGGAAVIVLPVLIYLLIASDAGAMWNQLIVFPATTLHRVRWLPYPAFQLDVSSLLSGRITDEFYRAYRLWLRFYLPLMVYGAAGLVIVLSWRRLLDIRRAGLIAVTLLGVLLFNQALSRYDRIHALPTSIVAALLMTLLLDMIPRRLWRNALFVIPVLAALYAIGEPYVRPFVTRHIATVKAVAPLGCYSQLERAGCVALDPAQAQAVEYIQAQTSYAEPIFVGNRRHDLIFVHDILFYFLADRPSPTRYHELYPGVATTLEVQQEIVAGLQAHQVNWIITVDLPASTEPNASAVSSGVTALDDFIRADYESVEQFGAYTLWRRRASNPAGQANPPFVP